MEQTNEPIEEKSLDEMSFSEALADEASKPQRKSTMISQLLAAFEKGEPSAIKVVTTAIIEHQYSEENKFPINDTRFKEIILLAAEAVSNGEI